jgi:hypothetical protein
LLGKLFQSEIVRIDTSGNETHRAW